MEEAVLPNGNLKNLRLTRAKRLFCLQVKHWFMVRYLRDCIITTIHQVLHKGTRYDDAKVAVLFCHSAGLTLFKYNFNQTIHPSTTMFNRNDQRTVASKHVTTFEKWRECFAGYIYSWHYLANAQKVTRSSLKGQPDIFGIAGGKALHVTIVQSKKAFMVWSIFVGWVVVALLDLITWTVATPTIGMHIDENHTKAIGKRFTPLV